MLARGRSSAEVDGFAQPVLQGVPLRSVQEHRPAGVPRDQDHTRSRLGINLRPVGFGHRITEIEARCTDPGNPNIHEYRFSAEGQRCQVLDFMPPDQSELIGCDQIIEAVARLRAGSCGFAQGRVRQLDPGILQKLNVLHIVDVSVGIDVPESDLQGNLNDRAHALIFAKPGGRPK